MDMKDTCDACGHKLPELVEVSDEMAIFCDSCFELWMMDPNEMLSAEEAIEQVRDLL